MRKPEINRLSGKIVLALSSIALLTVLSGYLQPSQTDEGTGAHIFQLSIVLLALTILLFLGTVDWTEPWRTARPLVVSAVVLALAFGALYYLENYRDTRYQGAAGDAAGFDFFRGIRIKSMRKIRTAMFGTGFMGKVHTEAIRRLGNVEVVAVAGVDQADAEKFAAAFGIPKAAGWEELLADKEIDAVHICTPNYLHYGMSKAALEAGKSVLCEKPLTMTHAEAVELAALAKTKNLANCVNHNLRCYPLVQQVRSMIEAGELGDVLIVNGTYFQDWLLYDTDWNWRAQANENGALRAMGDIGSHWMDQIQHVTGLKITSLCADLQTFHHTRKKPKGAVETFTGKNLAPTDYDSVEITTDDFGAVLVRLGDRARGTFAVSQMSAGRKNRFEFEIYGTKSGVAWNQERPDELWIGQRNSPNQIMIKDGSLMHPRAATFADLPGGHSEGYDDSHKQNFRRFYKHVADPSAPVEYPTFADGAHGMGLLEKVLESSKSRAWVDC